MSLYVLQLLHSCKITTDWCDRTHHAAGHPGYWTGTTLLQRVQGPASDILSRSAIRVNGEDVQCRQ
jgi:hypothetical protein